MSGLDAAAGVVGIASAGILVARGLFQIADAIGSAGEEVRVCAEDTALFSRMLDNLSDALKMPSAATRSSHNSTGDAIDVCERVLKPFQRLIAKLSPLLEKYRESKHQLRQISLRIQWCFSHKSKVLFYQQALNQLKTTLACLLDCICLQEARTSFPQKVLLVFMHEHRNSKLTSPQCLRTASREVSSHDRQSHPSRTFGTYTALIK